MLFCQITDTHLKAERKPAYGIVDTASMLERCVDSVMQLKQRPDVVLLTGDLVDYGRDDEYGLRATLLKPLTMPMYLIPGNHVRGDTPFEAIASGIINPSKVLEEAPDIWD